MKHDVTHVSGDKYATGSSFKRIANIPVGMGPTKEVKRLRNKQVRRAGKVCPRDVQGGAFEDDFPTNQVGACKRLSHVWWDKPASILCKGSRNYIETWRNDEKKRHPEMSDEQIEKMLVREYRKWGTNKS